eukprot:1234301-Pleurochrysis_carterae.AAC.2
MEAWAASMKVGGRGCPRSAGCSSTYSAPASRAAVSKAAVQRTILFAVASSRVCSGCTSESPSGCSRLRTMGGPPSGEELERKWRETEKFEHGGETTTTAYSTAAKRCKRR